MKSGFRKKLFRWIAILSAGFVLLFFFRLGYGYTLKVGENGIQPASSYIDIGYRGRNFASKKYSGKVSSESFQPAQVQVDQKYEKIAEVKTKTEEFEKSEKGARKLVKDYDGLVQYEQKTGNKGHRSLSLLIGVPPENFDSLYVRLIEIGKVSSKQITKTDKTNEYKELNAKKASLEKIRTSLIELKSKGGKIDEYMQLENRILEIEQQLQDLGVNLGDFDQENEFCTVKFSLAEARKATPISLMHRIKVALEWTIDRYLMLIATLFFIVLLVYLTLLAIDKLQLIQAIIKGEDPESE